MGTFIQFASALFAGIGVGVYAIWNGIKLFLSLSATRNTIIAAILGVPVAVVVVGLGIYKLIKFLVKRLG